MIKQLNQVQQFQETYGMPVINTPSLPSNDRCDMRQEILEEEVKELKEALNERDIVKVQDALIDCLYIIFGTMHEFGLASVAERCFDEVHRSNMSKLDADGKPIYRADGKVLKGENYTPPNLKDIIFQERSGC